MNEKFYIFDRIIIYITVGCFWGHLFFHHILKIN